VKKKPLCQIRQDRKRSDISSFSARGDAYEKQ
jgi:hypothetical protein